VELARTPEQMRECLTRRLRTDSADDRVRNHVRVVTGPQPYAHNHFAADQFFQFDPNAGAVHDLYGRRLLRVTGNFVRTLSERLATEVGEAAGSVLFKIGFRWGHADMRAFAERIQQEYEVEFEKLGMAMMLETWWWPLRACGWGTWHYDFRHARNGLIYIDLYDSAVTAALGRCEKCVCHLYAGLFAAVFSHLARRELSAVELRCAAKGDAHCRFLVGTAKRVKAAESWRDNGMDLDDMAQKLTTLAIA
jgi:predicted hydrocarbon binding protein